LQPLSHADLEKGVDTFEINVNTRRSMNGEGGAI
jgi:hypothetical protein